MNNFVNKASSKLDKLSNEQIKRVFSAQQKQLDLCNSILNGVDSGILVVSTELKILYVNRYSAELLQFDINAFKPGKTNLSDIIINNSIVSFLVKYIKEKKETFEHTFDFEHSILGDIKIHIKSFRTQDHFTLVIRDITLLDKFRQDFQRNESLASMTTMAAGIAHEIKNPLASMSIYLQLLNRKLEKNGSISKEEAESCLTIIGDEIDRLNSMAVDFLFAVKPMNIKMVIHNLNDIVVKSCSVIKAEVENQGIEFSVNIATSLPKVAIDEGLIEQCILNLVRNSVQAMDGKRQGKIVVSTYLESNNIVLSVLDNGVGMTDTQLTRIFEPYYTTKANGTGLGLTTIFKIVKEHGGEINVDSHPGTGSEFIIKLPVPNSERFKIDDKKVKDSNE